MAVQKNTPAVSLIAMLAQSRASIFEVAEIEGGRELTDFERTTVRALDVAIITAPALSPEDAGIRAETAVAALECYSDGANDAFWIAGLDTAVGSALAGA
jgi:hypothetical protein